VPYPVLPHQREDARKLFGLKTGYLAHEMRVGKTATVIRALDAANVDSVLWVTTGTARLGHADAWDRFSPLDRSVAVLTEGRQRPAADVVITSYDLASGPLAQPLKDRRFDAIVLDEAHKLKSHSAKRTRALLGEKCDRVGGIVEGVERVIPMSGTPAPNHPGELWPVLRALFPQAIVHKGIIMRRWDFEQRFCQFRRTPFGDKIVGGRNLAELKKRLEPWFIRRTFAETFPDAAGVNCELLFVEAQQNLDELKSVEHDDAVLKYKKLLDNPALSPVARRQILDDIDTHVAMRLRRLTGTAKVEGVVRWAIEALEDRRKIVLFGHHADVLDGLCEGLAQFNPVRVSGGVSPAAKGAAEKRFREDDKCRVFVGNLLAAGEAIDLSVADDVVLVESSWVPGENEQAIRRIVNMMKHRENIAWFATLAGSIDEHVQRTNARKTADLLQLFG